MEPETVLMRTKSRYEFVEIVRLTTDMNVVRKEVKPKGRGRRAYWSGRIVRLPRWEHVQTFISFSKEGLMGRVVEFVDGQTKDKGECQ